MTDDTPDTVAPHPHAPQARRSFAEIPGYEFVGRIDSGSQGDVYEVIQASTRRRVALKLLRGGAFATEEARKRFSREIDLVAQLSHPGIITLHDSGLVRDQPYYVMELLPGANIVAHAREKQLGVREICALLAAACDAVGYAHTHAVVHRDLKPGNILIDSSGQPRVVDFGIARTLDSPGLTAADQALGTHAYAAPEQLDRRFGVPSTRTDVHALGLIGYEMLTGRRAYAAHLAGEEAMAITEAPVPSAAGIRPDVDRDLKAVLLKAMAKDQERRYTTAVEFAADLRRWSTGEAVDARAGSRAYTLRRTLARHRIVVGAAAALFVASGAFSAVLVGTSREAAAARDHALAQEREARAVADFLIGFFDMDAGGRPGAPPTAWDLLHAGYERAEPNMALLGGYSPAVTDAVGRVYQRLGVIDKAVPVMVKARDARIQRLGPDHADVATSRDHVGMGLLAMPAPTPERLEDAVRELKEALRIRRLAFVEESDEVAESLDHLGLALLALGRTVPARALIQRGLDIRSALHGRRDTRVAESLRDLGRVEARMGELDRAGVSLVEAFAIQHAVLPRLHPELTVTARELARLREAQGDVEGAAERWRYIVGARLRALGDDSLQVAADRLSLASLLTRSREDLVEAELLVRDALDALSEEHWDEHPEIAAALELLARCQHGQGHVEEAARTFQDAVASLRFVDPAEGARIARLHESWKASVPWTGEAP